MRANLVAMLFLAGCGQAGPTPPAAPTPAPTPAPPLPAPPPAILPFAEVSARSGCANRSLEELCEGLREHYASYEGAWASDDCALGARHERSGPFAEARLIGIHSGYGPVEGTERQERPLFGATVHDPPVAEFSVNVLLAARVGEAWFPIHLFLPVLRGSDVGPEDFTWSLDEDGTFLEWTSHEGAGSFADTDGYGQAERTLAAVVQGVPVIAARATVELWRNEVQLECARACNAEPSPPPYPGCSERCAARGRTTRTWDRSGLSLRIGASVVERSGPGGEAIELTIEEAQTVPLDAPSPDMQFCAFHRRARALPRDTPRNDPESVALLERARALSASGAGHDVAGAAAAVEAGAARSIVAIDAELGEACGGGGCTVVLRHRTLDGAFPEEGVSFFRIERGTHAGCDAGALPTGEAPTLVEVAPIPPEASVGCGFLGWDGSVERRWVIVRVLE